MIRHRALVGPIAHACLAAVLLLGGCAQYKKNKDFENWSPTVPGGRFKTIGTVAATGARTTIRMMVQVRQQLNKAGVNAVRRSGRWDSLVDAVARLCAPGAEDPVDGVLVVSYDHLVLYNCETRKATYEIQTSSQGGGLGLREMTDRLIKYLRGDNKAPS